MTISPNSPYDGILMVWANPPSPFEASYDIWTFPRKKACMTAANTLDRLPHRSSTKKIGTFIQARSKCWKTVMCGGSYSSCCPFSPHGLEAVPPKSYCKSSERVEFHLKG